MNGTLRSVSHIGNDYKVLNATSQYPWATTSIPAGRSAVAKIRRQQGSASERVRRSHGTKAQVARWRVSNVRSKAKSTGCSL
jgi:hypothetical protein